jgi:hypothetical protein
MNTLYKEAINRIKQWAGIVWLFPSALEIIIFLELSAAPQHYTWGWVLLSFIISIPLTAILTIIIVMLKIKLQEKKLWK